MAIVKRSTLVVVVVTATLLMMSSNVGRAFHCPILECSCFYNGRETVKIACPPEHDGVQYTITHHVVEGELTVECLEPIAYRTAMFASFQFTNIVHIRFVKCPLPIMASDNMSFADIVQGVRPIVLSFNGDHGGDGDGGTVLDASLFANLTGLETLDLDGNGFVNVELHRDTVPDDWHTLESLSLADNRLTNVPKAILRLVPALHGFSLTGNMLRFLSDDDFESLAYLQNLKVDRNRIETVGPRVFKSLRALKLLRLNDNRLRSVPSQLLHGLTHLQFLDLSDNDLERIPAQFLKDNIHLKALKIRRNRRLTDLPEDLLWSATSLEELHLSDSNVTSIPELLFQNTLRLSRLNLRNNAIAALADGVFDNATRLTTLDLSGNRLSGVRSFDALVRLRELNLSHNALKTFDVGGNGVVLELVSLDLSHNLLDVIRADTFESMYRLGYLDLSYNFLVFLDDRHLIDVHQHQPPPPFVLPASVTSLNMSNNMIVSMDLDWVVDSNLMHFNVTFNQIKLVRIDLSRSSSRSRSSSSSSSSSSPSSSSSSFSSSNGMVVDLRHNLVNTVELTTDAAADNRSAAIVAVGQQRPIYRARVMLADNPIACDCNLLSFVNHVTNSVISNSSLTFEDVSSLVCTTPHELLDRPIESVLVDELYCPVTSDCGGDGIQCRCIRRAIDGTVSMDCRQKSLASFPLRAPANTTVLHLEGNNITSLERLADPTWSNLTELYVSDNSLVDMTLPVTMPRNLRLIHLDNNRLKYLPEWFLTAVDSTSEVGATDNETFVRMLRLGNNPWVCDCRNVAFQRWLLDNGDRVSDHADVVCKAKKVLERRAHTYVYGHLNRMILVECTSSTASDKTSVILAAVMSLFLTGALILGSKLMLRNFFKVKLFLLKLVIKRPTRKAISNAALPTSA